MTTRNYLTSLFQKKQALKNTLDNFGVELNGETKLSGLISLVGLIETGTGYMHATVIANKTNTLTFGGFTFVPHSFAITSLYALEHVYELGDEPFNVVGALTLESLEIGEHTHTVELIVNDVTPITITVTTNLTNSEGISTLTVTLPNNYYFLGENEWAVLGSAEEDDEE